MSYRSNFRLYVCDLNGKELEYPVQKFFIAEARKYSNEILSHISASGDSGDEVTWYEASTDMKKISVRFPYILWKLYRVGREDVKDDMEMIYTVNGEQYSEKAEIRFAPYDSGQLK